MLNPRQILSTLVEQPDTTSVFAFHQGAELESCRYTLAIAKRFHRDHLNTGALHPSLARAFVGRYWADTFLQMEPDDDASWALFNELVRAGAAVYQPVQAPASVNRSPAFDRLLRDVAIRPTSSAVFALTPTGGALHLPPDLPSPIGAWPWYVQIATAVFELITNDAHIDLGKHALRDLFPSDAARLK